MSQDEGIEYLERHYTESFGQILEEDAIDAYELHNEYGLDEYELDMMLDALHRQGHLSHITSDGGELYDAQDFTIENHQQIIEDFELL